MILFFVTLIIYSIMRCIPTSYVEKIARERASLPGGKSYQEWLTQLNAAYGFDKGIVEGYFSNWLGSTLKGDFGDSWFFNVPVVQKFNTVIWNSFILGVISFVLEIVIAVPLGILAAVRHDRFTDYFLRFCSFIGNALPNFFVALLLMQVFSIHWNIFPVISNGATLRSAVLPSLTLAIAMSAKYMRQVRAAVLEELGKDYVAGARARGVRGRVILWRSVLRSAMLTIITLLALSIGSLLGGTAIIESIFMWDGVGKLAVDAITMRDYPLIQAYVVWMAVIYVTVNLITDILYNALDPRIRLGVSEA